MKGEEHILVNFPIDTSLKKKAHSAVVKKNVMSVHPKSRVYFGDSEDGKCAHCRLCKYTKKSPVNIKKACPAPSKVEQLVTIKTSL